MRFRLLLPLLAAALTGCATTGPLLDKGFLKDPLHVEIYGRSAPPESVRTLIVVIHDDGDPGTRSDEDAFARAASAAIPESAAVTILRPGHRDTDGNQSTGEHGAGTGDNFTLDRLVRLGQQINDVRRRYPRANLVLVGDGGGAALVADLAGLQPEIAEGIVLVGCPCALPEWRKHMAGKTRDATWNAPVSSLDPLKFAGGVSTTLHVVVLVGADDSVTPVVLSRAYVEALTLRGIGTDYRIVPAKGHNLLGDPETLSAVTRLAATLPEKP